MDTIASLYEKYVQSSLNRLSFLCNGLDITSWEIQNFYNQAVLANTKNDTVWLAEILDWTGQNILVNDETV